MSERHCVSSGDLIHYIFKMDPFYKKLEGRHIEPLLIRLSVTKDPIREAVLNSHSFESPEASRFPLFFTVLSIADELVRPEIAKRPWRCHGSMSGQYRPISRWGSIEAVDEFLLAAKSPLFVMVAADPGSDPSTNAAAASFLRRVFSHMSTTSENQNRLYLLCLMHRGAEDYKDKKDEMDAALEDMVMTVLMDTTVGRIRQHDG
ncbi:hypothetical protein BGX33_009075 [Mortierella sp. NVP41]|nr:hypothetical protein BGX33_009075 [Mortierella sp. NVP41]